MKLHHGPLAFLLILKPIILNAGGMFSGLPDLRGIDTSFIENLFVGDPSADIAVIMYPKNIESIKSIEERNRLFFQILYCLAYAEDKRPFKRDAEDAIDQAGVRNGTKETPYFKIMKEQLLIRLEEADDYDILNEQDMQLLKQGQAPKIKKGLYRGKTYQAIEAIPSTICPEMKNEIINLRLLRDKSEWNEKEAIQFSKTLHANGLLTETGQKKFFDSLK